MSSSTSINLAALGFGGIDTSSLVTNLVAIENQPVQTMQTNQSNMQSAVSTLSSFSQALSALSNAATTLSDPTTFSAMAATSSDSSIAASASGSPAAGQWSVSVSQIAQAQRTMSTGQSSSSDALGMSGTLGITLANGTTASVNISATDSLSDIANAINSSGLALQAGVMYDGSQYHLLVSGNSTGASNAITFDESNITGTDPTTGAAVSISPLGLSASGANIQTAQDAKATVGGVAVTSPTNQIANAIPGVTLAVTQPTTSPATITVAGDSTGLQSQIQTFVSAYNAVISAGQTDAGYGTTAASNSLLQGDEAIHSAMDQLSQLIGEQVGSTGNYTTMASIGLTLNDDGSLSFDTSTFSAAVAADPTDVTNMFVSNSATGSTTGLMSQFNSVINTLTDPTTGAVQSEINGYQSRITNIGTQITNAQARVTAYQTQLQNEFTQMNTMLQTYKQQSSTLTQSFDPSSSSSSSSSSSVV
jgi:flagellar hook-associated protein 2